MRQYVIKRIGLFIPTVLVLTIIVFVLMRLIPGDPALAILNDGEGSYTQQELPAHQFSHVIPIGGCKPRAAFVQQCAHGLAFRQYIAPIGSESFI